MSIATTDRKAGPFLGDDVTTVFPFEFKVYDKDHLKVLLVNSKGEESELLLDTDYSVALNADQDGNPGGSVTLNVALATGEKLTIITDQPSTQEAVLANMGGFFPKTIEKRLDWLTILVQQLEERLDRALVAPAAESGPLPLPSNRANRFLAFDSSGAPIALQGTDGMDAQEVREAAMLHRDADLTVTVGTGGDYATINEALAALSKQYPAHVAGGFVAEVKLLSGFVMREQVLLRNGVDLGWIRITSEDPVVFIDNDAITEILVKDASLNESAAPVFGALRNSVLPTIGVQFEMQTQATTAISGVACFFGSKVSFLPESGIRKCGHGIMLFYNSEAYCYMPGLRSSGGTAAGSTTGVDFSSCAGRALDVQYFSRAGLARSKFNDCASSLGVYVIWGSRADIFQSDISNCAGTAVLARDGSFINARETNVSGSNVGYHALHGAWINARSNNGPWAGDGASNCADYGVQAAHNSYIECQDLNVTNCGNRAVWASDGSIINARGVNAANTSSTTTTGIGAVHGSTVNAVDAIVSGAVIGIRAESGSTINAEGVDASNCTDIGVLADKCSRVNFRGGNASGATNFGVMAREASTVNARLADVTNAGQNGIQANRSSIVEAFDADASGSTGSGFFVFGGSIIQARAATGTLSQTKNTLTADGIIFQP